jgi:hypothetical protein
MFDKHWRVQSTHVHLYMVATSFVLYLESWSGCLTLEKSCALCIVPQASRMDGCTTIEATPITAAPHPSTTWGWTCSGCSGFGFLRIGGQGGFDAPSNGWHLLKKLLGDRWFLGHPNGGPHDDLCTVETVYFLWCNLERKNSCSTFMMKVLLFSGLGLAVSICSFICVLSRKICYSFGCNKKTCNFFWSS